MTETKLSERKLFAYLIVDDIPVSAEEELMAHEGHGESLFNIGEIYYQKKDYPKALDWFRLGAAKENANAQYKMGWMHHKGLGVTVDHKAAMEWYLKSHNNGDSSATNNIGSLYDVGAGVQQDYKTALKWYLEAASKENACALYGVGMYYEKGRGVEKDVQYALEWFEKSATLGFELAKTQIKKLNNKGYHIGDRQRKYIQMEKDMHEQKMKIEEQRLMIEEQQYRIDLLEKSIIVSEQKRILDGRANEGQKRLLDRPANEDTEDDAVLLKKVKIESTI